MKVKELIAKLQTLEPETRVVVAGYEDGVDDVGEIEEVRIVLDHYVGVPGYPYIYGRHEALDEHFDKDKPCDEVAYQITSAAIHYV